MIVKLRYPICMDRFHFSEVQFHLNVFHSLTKSKLFVKLLSKPFSKFLFHKRFGIASHNEVEPLEEVGHVVWSCDKENIIISKQISYF